VSAKEAIEALRAAFGERILEAAPEPTAGAKGVAGVRDPWARVAARDLVEIATFCRDDPRLRFDLLSCLSAVDWPGEKRIEVVYHLDSTALRHWLVLKVDVPREAPRLPSLEKIWRAADWHEREAFDLMGVLFEGHHDLKRILCAEDWEGHPLRKDYVMPQTYHGIPNAYEQFYDVENP
jgi:NADH-quinone oxidoreductase subunit C